ncbi:uncharacterized protein LOC127289372 isoform X2 [Leptopilina boulardi]|uniref:uncharacterized protein LOC127289372 isoform X2 n=1 Tax=Leptopilina boulardi TaxID=63433 RepID=UPI0021F53E18|nr:uncharacterized protein LOC127289372 isoform X2 [Leptopilina boulardi]
MFYDNLANPIEAVYLISMYSYFNSLSDFLYRNNYSSINDRHKQIPVVNALYRYLDDNRDNQDDLIKSLLQGSDLYGEQFGEIPDETFVNTMFDYIITSLVFDKYGNIYGFLADVVRKSQDLHIDSLLKDIKRRLENIIFENEYGDTSSLTPLAVDRIFTDIILPLFPKPKTNIKLTSLDYIYAQAGAILLRPGIQNATYYSVLTERTKLNNKTLFDEYILIGHLIEELIIGEKFGQFNATAFALPALFFYVYFEKEKLEQEKITTIIFDPQHWLKAYNIFLTHLDKTYDKISSALKTDTKFKLHYELSQLKTHHTYARYLVEDNVNCRIKPEEEKIDRVSAYENNPHNFACKIGDYLPDINDYFLSKLNTVIQSYQQFENKSIAKVFKNYFQLSFHYTDAIIKLRDNIVVTDFYDPSMQSNDFLEIYFPANGTTNYFVVIREDYNHRIDKVDYLPDSLPQSDRPPIKKQDGKISFTQQLNEIREKIIKNKSSRLVSLILSSLNDKLKIDWWKEFGLSLVPFYPCLSGKIVDNNKKDPCQVYTFTMYPINLENDFITLNIIQEDTQALLTSIGTSIKTLSLKNLLIKIIEKEKYFELKSFENYLDYKRFSNIVKDPLQFNPNIVLSLSDPSYNIALERNRVLDIFRENVRDLKIITFLDYISIFSMTLNIRKCKNDFTVLSIGNSNHSNWDLKVKSQSIFSNSGYGYKFIYLIDYSVAYLRTIPEYGNTRTALLILIKISSENEKQFKVIDSTTLKETNEYVYENDNELQYNMINLEFNATYIADFNLIECRNETILSSKCPRIENREKQEEIQNKILRILRNNTLNYEENHIHMLKLLYILENYIFPDENFDIEEFGRNLKSEQNLLSPQYGKEYIMERRNDFVNLRYKAWLEEDSLSLEDATNKINKLYTPKERSRIEMETILTKIVENYNLGNERFSATFEDYYAIRNFATTGYKKITGDTNEAKRMKIALYNLAIRQSDDPERDFDLHLTTVESISKKSVRKLFYNEDTYTLQKFTFAASLDVTLAKTITGKIDGFENVLFEMSFSQRYIRAKIKQMFYTYNPMTTSILLPGTKFSIENKSNSTITGLGNVLRIKLKCIQEANDKYEWYQKIMNTISEIKL